MKTNFFSRSNKYQGINIEDDFSIGLGNYDYAKKVDITLWGSLIKWLSSLPTHEKDIILPYYVKIKKFSTKDPYFQKALQVYFLFRLRIEKEIHSLGQLKHIANKVFLETQVQSMHKQPDLLKKNISKFGSYISPNEIHKLHSWDPKYFTNLSIFPPFGSIALSQYKFIVHMIDEEYFSRLKFNHLEEDISTWDAVSTSLVSEKQNYFYKRFGVVLTVPVSNFLLTFSEDSMFANHIGNDKMKEFQLDKSIKTNNSEQVSNHIKSGLLSKHIHGKYRSFETPDEILKNAYTSRTEVIVCGRPGVNIHPNFPRTGKIKIAATIIVNDKTNQTSFKNNQMIMEVAKTIQNTYKVPLIRLEGHVNTMNMF